MAALEIFPLSRWNWPWATSQKAHDECAFPWQETIEGVCGSSKLQNSQLYIYIYRYIIRYIWDGCCQTFGWLLPKTARFSKGDTHTSSSHIHISVDIYKCFDLTISIKYLHHFVSWMLLDICSNDLYPGHHFMHCKWCSLGKTPVAGLQHVWLLI